LSLIDLLGQLRQEASHLTMKSLPVLGLDYRGRTKLERVLFAILRDYCAERFDYDLGGVTYSHRRTFEETVSMHPWAPREVEPVRNGLDVCDLIRDIASSDPYVVEDAIGGLGVASDGLLGALQRELHLFVDRVEAVIQTTPMQGQD
jgi:hypothetical protein